LWPQEESTANRGKDDRKECAGSPGFHCPPLVISRPAYLPTGMHRFARLEVRQNDKGEEPGTAKSLVRKLLEHGLSFRIGQHALSHQGNDQLV
jgi:hypothetical protein